MNHTQDITPQQTLNAQLQSLTPARVGLGRYGAAVPTAARLELLSAHAQARDAVHSHMDMTLLREQLGEILEIHSQAKDRREYLLRPDYGRAPRELPPELADYKADIGIVLIDGLSPAAVSTHGPQLYTALKETLKDYKVAPPVVGHQGRVALGDHIGQAAAWDITLVVIGERPGLSVPSSLGIYSTWKTYAGITEERRNCISNIHPPEGMSYHDAALIALDYVEKYYQAGQSGFMIKAKEIAPQLEQK
ncbi:ethanolamine ammonia-lyase subunit EutC [Corynebacterium sp. sy017]|uniref:ethanolamine ammonia-lyase subunit EutC n=1 Tax=unclassified Corynebacterium TaxID=2624378 RepID=UPI001185873E|nr:MULTISPECIES: ethanolamine ammonia-lyase subunit EutC [unclassified Corynebacterium]MBP3087895.1 ethanolamine ammonia-lyase subunit EutC [Corynebacterium sp. sy017]QDZ42863.1 ethanolamine ammonia-lyase subunit EutC [Corynebacterium sp. sy039]TSD92436.1 ethanolamine ammonia-lyase subunit EutC [Corynebacterium sp. SY003]